MLLTELHDSENRGIDLDNVSLESATVNRKSFFRVFEGVRLTEDYVKDLINRGQYPAERRKEYDSKLKSSLQLLLRDCFGGNS